LGFDFGTTVLFRNKFLGSDIHTPSGHRIRSFNTLQLYYFSFHTPSKHGLSTIPGHFAGRDLLNDVHGQLLLAGPRSGGPRHPKLGGKGAGSAGRRASQRLDPTSSAHCRLSGVTVTIVNPDGLYAEGGSLRPLLALHRTTTFCGFFLSLLCSVNFPRVFYHKL
jgi:hypothetical protein